MDVIIGMDLGSRRQRYYIPHRKSTGRDAAALFSLPSATGTAHDAFVRTSQSDLLLDKLFLTQGVDSGPRRAKG